MIKDFSSKNPEVASEMGRLSGKLQRSGFKFTRQGQSGIEVSELFPQLANHVDDMCIVRSMSTKSSVHELAQFLMNTGDATLVRPSLVKGTRMGKIDESALELNREGGKPSKDKAAIRRWISPQGGHVDIYAALVHLSKTGEGVLCRLVSSRAGLLGERSAANSSRLTTLNDIEVKKGQTLDFVTECRDDPKNDSFKWAPTITMRDSEIPGMKGMSMRWDARSDFMDPATMPKPLGPWEELAQVLLLSNEFTFVE